MQSIAAEGFKSICSPDENQFRMFKIGKSDFYENIVSFIIGVLSFIKLHLETICILAMIGN